MTDKGHCFMQSEVFDEYAEFYDFSPQIEAAIEYQKTLKNKTGQEKTIEIIQNTKEGDEDAEEWESDNDDEVSEEEENGTSDAKVNLAKKTIKEEDENVVVPEKKSKKPKKVEDLEWEDENEEEDTDFIS